MNTEGDLTVDIYVVTKQKSSNKYFFHENINYSIVSKVHRACRIVLKMHIVGRRTLFKFLFRACPMQVSWEVSFDGLVFWWFSNSCVHFQSCPILTKIVENLPGNWIYAKEVPFQDVNFQVSAPLDMSYILAVFIFYAPECFLDYFC